VASVVRADSLFSSLFTILPSFGARSAIRQELSRQSPATQGDVGLGQVADSL
jgi:hypothetical protein